MRRMIVIVSVLLALCVIGVAFVVISNICVKSSVKERIISAEQAAKIEDADCIIILGCLVKSSGEPSDMLSDRLERGVEIYDLGGAPKILMSGDHGRAEYDEVGAMKEYAVENGVPSEDVFLDHAGFSTYESMYRAKEIFGVKKAIIVTQGYHLYRALYIAKSLGIDAYGVASDQRTYVNQTFRDVREALARSKDMLYCAIKPAPTYLGEKISLDGDGNITNG